MANVNRNKLLLGLSKTVLLSKISNSANMHYDIDPETLDCMKNKANRRHAFLYAGTHKSLWETVGVPYVINKYSGDVPFIMTGDNLLCHKFVKFIADRIGVVPVKRDNGFKNGIEVVNDISSILLEGYDAESFPEGKRTRTGKVLDFKVASFEAAINASKQSMDYASNNAFQKNAVDIKIIPFTVDYTRLPEIDYLSNGKGIFRPKMKDYIDWWNVNAGDVYLSFAKPISVLPSSNREELAYITRKECMNLAKILPISIVSEAMVRMASKLNPKSTDDTPIEFTKDDFSMYIEGVKNDLKAHREKFRGFSMDDPARDILYKTVADGYVGGILRYEQEIDVHPEDIKKFSIHAGYISHYLSDKK